MTSMDDFIVFINSLMLGEDPAVEDFILLLGTLVAFVAFVVWFCFPVVPTLKDPMTPPKKCHRLRKTH